MTTDVAYDLARLRLERARSRSVMIATPVARAPCLDYTVALAESCVHLTQTGIRYQLQFVVGSSNLPKARNELVARFLASECTDLLFIDDDMGWKPESIVRLLASDKEIIGGVGRKRVEKPNSDPNVWCCRFLDDAAASLRQDDMGNIEVEGIGTGFLKISRDVFERLALRHPDWKRRGHDGMSDDVRAKYYSFFAFGDDDLGEDYLFCRRCREDVWSIWIDPSIALRHVGTHSYSGCIAELMVAG